MIMPNHHLIFLGCFGAQRHFIGGYYSWRAKVGKQIGGHMQSLYWNSFIRVPCGAFLSNRELQVSFAVKTEIDQIRFQQCLRARLVYNRLVYVDLSLAL